VPDRIFGDREKAMEEAFFRQEDAKLLKKLRDRAHLDEIALALGEKLQVDNPELLERVRATGVSLDTAAAMFLAPLVQVAWAGGSVTKAERHTVLRLAKGRGIDPLSPAYAQLEEWLRERPADALFDTSVEVINYGFSSLLTNEKEERIKLLIDACHEVAEASGSSLGFVLGLKNVIGLSGVDGREAEALELIARKLRKSPDPT
jgi:hypothetical protein